MRVAKVPCGYPSSVAVGIRAGASGIPLLALGLALSACGGSQDVAAADTAEAFYGALGQGDGAAACALLTPATRSELEQSSGKACDQAILEELSTTRGDDHEVVEVFETMAQVRWRDETVFLTRMPEGWRVLAAGCTPRAGDPYNCVVKGG